MNTRPNLLAVLAVLSAALIVTPNFLAADQTPPSKTEPTPGKKEDPKKGPEKKAKQDGLSFETAIVIKEKTTAKGVPAEYAWLRRNLPGHKVIQQSLSSKGDKKYDVFDIQLKDGTERKVYFDITGFFGKH